MKTFSIKLKDWMDAQKLTMTALAIQLGTNRVSVRYWIAGRAFPRDEFCEKLFTVTHLDCFGPGRDEAREEHERSIPADVRKQRKAKYDANADLYRSRALASSRKRYEARRQFVSTEEREALRKDPRQRKNVCRECGEILADVGPHLRPSHDMTVDAYKEKWGFLRSRNATRSEETQQKQSAAMRRTKHKPPKWTHDFLRVAQEASLKTNRPGSARLEERLNARGKRLEARPKYWKRT